VTDWKLRYVQTKFEWVLATLIFRDIFSVGTGIVVRWLRSGGMSVGNFAQFYDVSAAQRDIAARSLHQILPMLLQGGEGGDTEKKEKKSKKKNKNTRSRSKERAKERKGSGALGASRRNAQNASGVGLVEHCGGVFAPFFLKLKRGVASFHEILLG
jgi:hypothetical protein